jgi:hypothetical protein
MVITIFYLFYQSVKNESHMLKSFTCLQLWQSWLKKKIVRQFERSRESCLRQTWIIKVSPPSPTWTKIACQLPESRIYFKRKYWIYKKVLIPLIGQLGAYMKSTMSIEQSRESHTKNINVETWLNSVSWQIWG